MILDSREQTCGDRTAGGKGAGPSPKKWTQLHIYIHEPFTLVMYLSIGTL